MNNPRKQNYIILKKFGDKEFAKNNSFVYAISLWLWSLSNGRYGLLIKAMAPTIAGVSSKLVFSILGKCAAYTVSLLVWGFDNHPAGILIENPDILQQINTWSFKNADADVALLCQKLAKQQEIINKAIDASGGFVAPNNFGSFFGGVIGFSTALRALNIFCSACWNATITNPNDPQVFPIDALPALLQQGCNFQLANVFLAVFSLFVGYYSIYLLLSCWGDPIWKNLALLIWGEETNLVDLLNISKTLNEESIIEALALLQSESEKDIAKLLVSLKVGDEKDAASVARWIKNASKEGLVPIAKHILDSKAKQ